MTNQDASYFLKNPLTTASGFAKGFGLFFTSYRIMKEHRSLWNFSIIPLVLNVLVFGLGFFLLTYFRAGIVESVWAYPMGEEWYTWILVPLWYLFSVLIFVAFMLMTYFLFTPLGMILAAPFSDMLSEQVERLLRPDLPELPFKPAEVLRDIGVSLGSEMKKMGLRLAILLPLLVVNLIPGIGQIIVLVVGGALASAVLALDFIDYPMSRRRWTFSDKINLFKEDWPTHLGFGLAVLLAMSIPLINFVFLPLAVVGGTVLFHHRRPEEPFPDYAIRLVTKDDLKGGPNP